MHAPAQQCIRLQWRRALAANSRHDRTPLLILPSLEQRVLVEDCVGNVIVAAYANGAASFLEYCTQGSFLLPKRDRQRYNQRHHAAIWARECEGCLAEQGVDVPDRCGAIPAIFERSDLLAIKSRPCERLVRRIPDSRHQTRASGLRPLRTADADPSELDGRDRVPAAGSRPARAVLRPRSPQAQRLRASRASLPEPARLVHGVRSWPSRCDRWAHSSRIAARRRNEFSSSLRRSSAIRAPCSAEPEPRANGS